MKQPKIKTALSAAFIAIGVIFAGFATYAVTRLETTNGFVADLATNWMPSQFQAQTIALSVSQLRATYRDHILANDDAGRTQAEARLANVTDTLSKAISSYEALDTDGADTIATRGIRADLEAYQAVAAELLKFSRENDDASAVDVLYQKVSPIGDKISAAAAKLVDINKQGADQAYANGEAVYHTSLMMTFVATGMSVVAIVGSICFSLMGIAKPIQKITEAMQKLARGDISSPVPYEGRTDEIGEMAAAVGVFRDNAIANRRLEEEAAANRNLSEEERRRKAEADRIRTEEMAQATTGLASGLKHLAGGDLTFQLTEAFAPDFEALRSDFNSAVDQLADTMRAVAQAATQIDGGTQEISQAAEDLSRRTEQQAASLEETAAALDQITANVASSSKRAEEARDVAVQANQSAAHSGKIVSNAVDAMGRIEQSSNQISSIIGVIDEIAFQTNLLALNAGVEAARAGDAGKGFAVVAQEVRELAQRSAHAAKEIKDLIRSSSGEVESGVRLVSETGDALKTIESFIVTVNQHMEAIATSAREQSVGLSEVNTAVNQMDQVTQQNAAMVEESTAASATLSGEAGRLRDLIGQFRIGGKTGHQVNALRQTASAMAAARRERIVGPVAAYGKLAIRKDEWAEF